MKARLMTFGRRAHLVLQGETDAERAELERIRTMRRDGRIELEGEWCEAPTFVLELDERPEQ